MKLPTPIQRYFEADQSGDAEQVLDAFTPDAVVKDEGHTHIGQSEIASWWNGTRAKYRHRAHPRQVQENGPETIVRAEVTGDFPGSPAMLGFAFQLHGNLISRLEIGA